MPQVRGVIERLDHMVLIAPDASAATVDYTRVFGRGPDWVSRDEVAGTSTLQFRTDNCALEIMAPEGDGAVADRLRNLLSEGGPRLTSLAFASDRIDETHRKLARRGLQPGEISEGSARHAETGAARAWRRFRCSDDATAGIKTFIIGQTAPGPLPDVPAGGVTRLDHLVIETPNPDRALAIYGARLGLDLALDRTAPEWKTRFLFFRLGGLTLEVVHRLDGAHDPAAPDRLWGLTWEVADIDAAHARLAAQGVDVSGVRTGRKPGTRVFTLRNCTLGVPTLFIAHSGR